jgi:hypothetical protein
MNLNQEKGKLDVYLVGDSQWHYFVALNVSYQIGVSTVYNPVIFGMSLDVL